MVSLLSVHGLDALIVLLYYATFVSVGSVLFSYFAFEFIRRYKMM